MRPHIGERNFTAPLFGFHKAPLAFRCPFNRQFDRARLDLEISQQSRFNLRLKRLRHQWNEIVRHHFSKVHIGAKTLLTLDGQRDVNHDEPITSSKMLTWYVLTSP